MSMPVSPVARHYEACLNEQPVVTEANRGPVEYAERGQGPLLLSLHGSPAAFENGLLVAEFAEPPGSA